MPDSPHRRPDCRDHACRTSLPDPQHAAVAARNPDRADNERDASPSCLTLWVVWASYGDSRLVASCATRRCSNHSMASLDNFRLVVFRAVAEQRSFRKAAEELYLTQPAVSLQIRSEERRVGVRSGEGRGGGEWE